MTVNNISETKNQHFIPRFLLKNFSWCINPSQKKKRQKFKIFFTTLSNPGQKKDINRIACADYFYEEEMLGDVEIEKQLSERENRYARSLNIVLDRSVIEKSQYQIISNFIFNLTWRTENNRVLMTSIMQNGFEGVAIDMMSDRKEIAKLQNKAFDDYVYKHGVNADRNQKAKFMQQASPILTADMKERMNNLLENELPSLMKNFASDTQSKLVTKDNFVSHPIMSKVIWEMRTVELPLILGDVGPIGFCNESGACGPLFWMVASTNIDYIYLPITPYKYLIGSSSGVDLDNFSSSHTVDSLNTLSAQQSYAFYVSNEENVSNQYSSFLGSTHSNYQSDWSLQSLRALMN